jgi:hypothetical protein
MALWCRLCFGDATPSSRTSFENAMKASHLHEISGIQSPKNGMFPQNSSANGLWQRAETQLSEYKLLAPRWHDWKTVSEAYTRCSARLFADLATPDIRRCR